MRRRWLAFLMAVCLSLCAAAGAEDDMTLYAVEYDEEAFKDWQMAPFALSDTLLLLSTDYADPNQYQILVLLVGKSDCASPADYIAQAYEETASYAKDVRMDGPFDWADPWRGGGKFATISSKDGGSGAETFERLYVAECEGRYCVVWLIDAGTGSPDKLDQLADGFLNDKFAVRARPADGTTTAYIESARMRDGGLSLMTDTVSLVWSDAEENYAIVNDDGGAKPMPVAQDAKLYFPKTDDMETPSYVSVELTEEALSSAIETCLKERGSLLFDLVTKDGEIIFISYCYIF